MALGSADCPPSCLGKLQTGSSYMGLIAVPSWVGSQWGTQSCWVTIARDQSVISTCLNSNLHSSRTSPKNVMVEGNGRVHLAMISSCWLHWEIIQHQNGVMGILLRFFSPFGHDENPTTKKFPAKNLLQCSVWNKTLWNPLILNVFLISRPFSFLLQENFGWKSQFPKTDMPHDHLINSPRYLSLPSTHNTSFGALSKTIIHIHRNSYPHSCCERAQSSSRLPWVPEFSAWGVSYRLVPFAAMDLHHQTLCICTVGSEERALSSWGRCAFLSVQIT